MKNIFFPFFFLVYSTLSAQTISNITLDYSCPCKVTATYDLDVMCENDVQLYYSPDTIAYGWLLAETFFDKTAGTHTDIWDCEAAGVVYGQFFFKMEVEVVIVTQCCQPSICLAMVFVEGGTFRLGAAVQPGTELETSGTEVAITNNHDVTLSNFCMSETPVTQAQFLAVMGVSPSYFNVAPYLPSGNKPVEQVSWYDAITFCNKLSLRDSKTPVYSVKVGGVEIDWANLSYFAIPTSSNTNWNAATMDMSANGYRLPTEAEWEYAAREGQESVTVQSGGLFLDLYYSGGNTANDVAWYRGNNGISGTPTYGTKPVKQKRSNALGLYDMSGNVWEWCWDWYGAYTNTPAENPTGPASGSSRVYRGGSWNNAASNARVSDRSTDGPFTRINYRGFRLVCGSE